jgi:predicted ATPase
MKIDIHTHTKKCKSGDAPTREISPEKFCESLLATDVKIVAITNHNVFDHAQYTDIVTRLGKDAQVWPGIELDVVHTEARAHLLVIVSPKLAKEFAAAVTGLTGRSTPDTFTASIEEVLAKFDSFNPLYVAHYKKNPSLSDEALAQLVAGTKNPACVVREVSNSISAGIYISHGHASIYGSDVQDWAKYEEISRQLPDLRLPVDSFEHFCLLLKKDPTAINTTLNKKTSEELTLTLFDGSTILKIRAFNDINVIFGAKGTGKSCILEAIANHYSDSGVAASVYMGGKTDRLEEEFDVRGKNLKVNLDDYGISHCSAEIDALRKASEVNVTSVLKYKAHFDSNTTNRNAKKILIRNLATEDENEAKEVFEDFNAAVVKTKGYLEFLEANGAVKEVLTPEEHRRVADMLEDLRTKLQIREWEGFAAWQEIRLMNSAIKLFRDQVEMKTGTAANPTTTGFRDYALNRIDIAARATEIVTCVEKAIPGTIESVGSLGPNKGGLEYRTEFRFQTGDVMDGSLLSLVKKAKKSSQKEFVVCVRKIQKHAFADDLFQCISDLNEVEDVEDIKTLNELILFKRYFALNDANYVPSTGEVSMVLLQKELGTNKDVYILDEPEKSLGNEYISEVIVPLIREHARAGKKVFISTHDANIAVRTLPYNSIYRCHGPKGYKTYFGNPFSNNLVNPDDEDRLEWKKVSMKTLEGGEDAFGERGKIYGNEKS